MDKMISSMDEIFQSMDKIFQSMDDYDIRISSMDEIFLSMDGILICRFLCVKILGIIFSCESFDTDGSG